MQITCTEVWLNNRKRPHVLHESVHECTLCDMQFQFNYSSGFSSIDIQGEKGSNDYAASQEFVQSLTAHIIWCKYHPRDAIRILISIDKCGMQYTFKPVVIGKYETLLLEDMSNKYMLVAL